MNRVLRAVLVWVMVIAMPMQGMAASLMLFCGPSHERMMQGLFADAPAARPAQASEGAHRHSDAGQAAQHHASQGDAVASQPAADATADAVADHAGKLRGHHGKVICSACAACCPVLALPAGFTLPEAVRATHPMQTASSAPVASHQPDGPDRPPRADHA